MALITENGSIVAGAESLCSVADSNTYHMSIGNEASWFDLDVDVKERALRKATIFMRQVYRSRWDGARVSSAQALDWPRYGICVDGFPVLSTTIPEDVKRACAELALRSIGEDLLPDLDIGNNQIKKDKTGPLETEYFENNTDARSRFASIDALLAPYFGTAGGDGTIKLVRG
jgi:hypothetical protein